jgi:hypothetical protein
MELSEASAGAVPALVCRGPARGACCRWDASMACAACEDKIEEGFPPSTPASWTLSADARRRAREAAMAGIPS